MESVYTTKLSSRGQVVIPEEVRNRLGLKPGDQFVVVGKEDTVVLKSIAPPRLKDFESLIHTARAQAKTARLKRSDISQAIARVRRGK